VWLWPHAPDMYLPGCLLRTSPGGWLKSASVSQLSGVPLTRPRVEVHGSGAGDMQVLGGG
jgi:hypothetical protein